jgi:hypothetical protein
MCVPRGTLIAAELVQDLRQGASNHAWMIDRNAPHRERQPSLCSGGAANSLQRNHLGRIFDEIVRPELI